MFNKIDRLILELRLSPIEAYHHLIRILEQVNAITGKLWASDRIEAETRRHELVSNSPFLEREREGEGLGILLF